jgi:hypothetical protein
VLALMVACSSAAPDPASKTTVVEAPKKPAWARSYRFTDTTSGAVASSTRTWGSTWADFDSDGDPDPLVNRHWGTPQFLVNRNDEFHHYAGRIDWHPGPKKTDRHACAWGEANRDGRPDLYCTQGADMGTGSGPNRLYVQARDGFDERARQYDVTNPKGRGRTVNWLDYDSDGDLDLFVGNAERSITTNLMFRHTRTKYVRARVGLDQDLSTAGSSWADWDRDGDPDLTIQQHDPYPTLAYENVKKRFKPVRLAGITGKTWLAATWGDFNGDGWPDVAMVGNNSAAIFRNNRGRFRRVRRVKVAEGRMGVWLDVENDGDLDLFVVQGAIGQRPQPDSKNYGDLLFVRRKGKFVKIVANGASSEGSGDAVSASDYDRDGRVDVLVTNGYFYYEGPNELLRNTSSARNWAGLQLRGPRANPLGFGATVRVETNGRTYHRQITDNFSFRAQSEVGYVHLGLGRARTARVRVDWPGRDTDCLSVTEGSVTQVRHGTNRCR